MTLRGKSVAILRVAAFILFVGVTFGVLCGLLTLVTGWDWLAYVVWAPGALVGMVAMNWAVERWLP